MTATRSSRFVMMLTEQEASEIQAYRFANRIGSKAEAARSLIASGLSGAEQHRAKTGTAPGDEIAVLAPDAVRT